MRKLKLDPEALQVETFSPSGARSGRGTVHGHYSYPDGCFPPSGSYDPALDTCGYATCAGNTCWQSCNGYTCGCDGGGGSSQCESAGPTLCMGEYSCINQCHPTPP